MKVCGYVVWWACEGMWSLVLWACEGVCGGHTMVIGFNW